MINIQAPTTVASAPAKPKIFVRKYPAGSSPKDSSPPKDSAPKDLSPKQEEQESKSAVISSKAEQAQGEKINIKDAITVTQPAIIPSENLAPSTLAPKPTIEQQNSNNADSGMSNFEQMTRKIS